MTSIKANVIVMTSRMTSVGTSPVHEAHARTSYQHMVASAVCGIAHQIFKRSVGAGGHLESGDSSGVE